MLECGQKTSPTAGPGRSGGSPSSAVSPSDVVTMRMLAAQLWRGSAVQVLFDRGELEASRPLLQTPRKRSDRPELEAAATALPAHDGSADGVARAGGDAGPEGVGRATCSATQVAQEAAALAGRIAHASADAARTHDHGTTAASKHHGGGDELDRDRRRKGWGGPRGGETAFGTAAVAKRPSVPRAERASGRRANVERPAFAHGEQTPAGLGRGRARARSDRPRLSPAEHGRSETRACSDGPHLAPAWLTPDAGRGADQTAEEERQAHPA